MRDTSENNLKCTKLLYFRILILKMLSNLKMFFNLFRRCFEFCKFGVNFLQIINNVLNIKLLMFFQKFASKDTSLIYTRYGNENFTQNFYWKFLQKYAKNCKKCEHLLFFLIILENKYRIIRKVDFYENLNRT